MPFALIFLIFRQDVQWKKAIYAMRKSEIKLHETFRKLETFEEWCASN